MRSISHVDAQTNELRVKVESLNHLKFHRGGNVSAAGTSFQQSWSLRMELVTDEVRTAVGGELQSCVPSSSTCIHT